ncbi:MAG: ribonuclease P protein component [Malacoplasma sp.]|mgnify:CR=1 FL=1|nr:ribonuclease P protein component [Malacoplasma sp.]
MKKKEYVLSNKKDFKNLFDNKTTYYSSFFILYVAKNNINHLRYAIGVNKKKYSKAVERNKIKRQVRNIVKDLDDSCLKKPYDILIIPKSNNCLKIKFFDKKQDLLNIIAKIYLKNK